MKDQTMGITIPLCLYVANTDCLSRGNKRTILQQIHVHHPDSVGLLEVLMPNSTANAPAEYQDYQLFREGLAELYPEPPYYARQWYATHQELGSHHRNFGGLTYQVMLATTRPDLAVVSVNPHIVNPPATDFTYPGEINQADHARPILELYIDCTARVIKGLNSMLEHPIHLDSAYVKRLHQACQVHYFLVHGPHSENRRGNAETIQYFSKIKQASGEDIDRYPTFIVGDFNATPDYAELWEMFEPDFANLTIDARVKHSTIKSQSPASVDTENGEQLVDYVLASRKNVKPGRIIMMPTGGDHLATLASCTATFYIPIPAELH